MANVRFDFHDIRKIHLHHWDQKCDGLLFGNMKQPNGQTNYK